jgi:hypothetical protein
MADLELNATHIGLEEAARIRRIDRIVERLPRIHSGAACWACAKRLRMGRAIELRDLSMRPVVVHVECARNLLFHRNAFIPGKGMVDA